MSLFSKISNKFNFYRKIPHSVVEIYREVKNFLPRNPIVLEAGAHMGYDTLGLSKIWPKGFIHAFEPVPALYEALRERVKFRKNVRGYNIALGEKDNVTVTMNVSGGESSGSSSILKPSKHLEMFPGVSFEEQVSVNMRTIQSWATQEKISNIDLMWLDMQGYEVNALKGTGKMLEKVSVIYTELCADELYQGLITKDAYTAFLKESGFELVRQIGKNEILTDGIFVNKKILKT